MCAVFERSFNDDPYEGLFQRGDAIGHSNIEKDTVEFRFRDEKFEFPAIAVVGNVATFNGYFYTAPVRKLRELRERN